MLMPAAFTGESSITNSSSASAGFPPRNVSAVELVRPMQGRTRPSLLRCNDGKYYVVKFDKRCRQERTFVNELLAGLLARLIGLPVREPVLVEVPRSFSYRSSTTTEPTIGTSLVFGSAYPHPPKEMLVTDFLPDRLLRRVVNVEEVFLGAFVFDLWICNSGRRDFIFSRPASEEGASYSAWLIDHDAAFNDGNWKFPGTFVPFLYGKRLVCHAASRIDSWRPSPY